MTEIKRLGGGPNAVVVQPPERHAPGVVVQKDSMDNLVQLLDEALRLSSDDIDEAMDILRECLELTRAYSDAFALSHD